MKLDELQIITKQGESTTLEFKKSTAQMKNACETVCAFLNNHGGKVIVGVTNDGQCVGQQVTDSTRQEIAHELSKIEPSIQIDVQYISFNDKHIILFDVPSGLHAPYVYDGRPFQRDQSTTRRMAQQRYDQLIASRMQLNYSWEDTIATEYGINDLDHEEIYKTIADGVQENRIPATAQKEDILKILERLNLMSGRQLKRATVVLYAKEDSLKFTQCTIKMARFAGKDKLGEFIDNQVIHGNAFKLLSEANIFLRRHLPIASFFKADQFKRLDKPALPVMAVREALINALVHRDYSDRTTDISLAIFDDRLELWNSGLLADRLTIEDLKHVHESVRRNKLIADIFYLRGLIEKWGIGTNKMINLCKKDGLPEPEFMERTGGLQVTFKFKQSIVITDVEKSVPAKNLNERQEWILNFMKKIKKATTQQIMNDLTSEFSKIPTKKTIVRDLNHLKALQLLYSEGQKKGVIWIYED